MKKRNLENMLYLGRPERTQELCMRAVILYIALFTKRISYLALDVHASSQTSEETALWADQPNTPIIFVLYHTIPCIASVLQALIPLVASILHTSIPRCRQ
jgi:hypothetical protein